MPCQNPRVEEIKKGIYIKCLTVAPRECLVSQSQGMSQKLQNKNKFCMTFIVKYNVELFIKYACVEE